MTRIAVNGIELNVEVSGEGPALLLLHGFTGEVSTWEPFLDAWPGFRLVRVDLIGHGASDAPADASRYSMGHAVDDLVALLDHLGIETTALLGYSMGGRLALHLALAAPERLSALVLESAAPGIADPPERISRVASDGVLADAILRDGIEPFVDRWQAQALFASQAQLEPAVRERQRRQRLSGSPLGLAGSLRGMGAGTQEYLLPRLRGLNFRIEASGETKKAPFPTLLLAGALDTRYVSIAGTLSRTLPESTVEVIEGAGHAAHLERPEVFARLVRDFLLAHVPQTPQEVPSS